MHKRKFKHPLIIGNWKLNGSKKIFFEFIDDLIKRSENLINCNIVIAPPTIYLDMVSNCLKKSKNIALGAQDVDIHVLGSYTGETSVIMLKDVGVKYVIIGHSERRILYNETGKNLAKKFSLIKDVGLIPVFCIGENFSENRLNQTKEVCLNQINEIINRTGIISLKNSVIAYEPIWSIGTGKFASPVWVQKIHRCIRDYISLYSKEIAQEIIIQYGGSVNSENVEKFLDCPDIDGVLVGKNCLNIDNFFNIIDAVEKLYLNQSI